MNINRETDNAMIVLCVGFVMIYATVAHQNDIALAAMAGLLGFLTGKQLNTEV